MLPPCITCCRSGIPCGVQIMPASARVSAYFYLGRTEVSSGHIPQGLRLLEQAFMECKSDSKNVQTILRFLVPVSGAGTGAGSVIGDVGQRMTSTSPLLDPTVADGVSIRHIKVTSSVSCDSRQKGFGGSIYKLSVVGSMMALWLRSDITCVLP